MSMFDKIGHTAGRGGRKPNTLRKLERLNAALRHQEPDRVPISDFFWGSFTERWRQELNLPAHGIVGTALGISIRYIDFPSPSGSCGRASDQTTGETQL